MGAVGGARHGYESPADYRHIHNAHGGHCDAHRCKVEHGVRRAQSFSAEGGNDNIGRCANEGDHAAQNGGKRQGHERQCRAPLGLFCCLQINRHQERQRRHVVHQRREGGRYPRHQRNMLSNAPGAVEERAGNEFDRAREIKTAADNEHQGNDDYCGVPEAGKDLFCGDQSQQVGDEQRPKRHQIVAVASPDQKHEQRADQRKQHGLV